MIIYVWRGGNRAIQIISVTRAIQTLLFKAWLSNTRTSPKRRVFSNTPENTRKILEEYFGSAFGELGTIFIVITIRTRFSDIGELIGCLILYSDGGVEKHLDSWLEQRMQTQRL